MGIIDYVDNRFSELFDLQYRNKCVISESLGFSVLTQFLDTLGTKHMAALCMCIPQGISFYRYMAP